MLKGFRQFIMRGNVVDLAVGVVIGAAFGSVVNALVKDLITPLIAAIAKSPDFSGLFFTIHKSRFLYGDFINSVVSFVIIAAAVYFFVVTPLNTFMNKMGLTEPAEANKKCPECLSDIPEKAKRCSHCGQPVI